MAEENLNIIQKLAKVRGIADFVKKDKKGFNYTYADITAILAKVKAGMQKYGVTLIPNIVPGTTKIQQIVSKDTKFDKAGNAYEKVTTEMLVDADMVFKWINEDNMSEYIEVPWHVVGMQSDPSQAFGSGLSYCTRYFLTDYFQIAQSSDTDIDAYRSKLKEAEASEGKAIAEGIIEQFDKTVKAFLADNQDKADAVKKFISRYAKNANYFAIKEPNLAAKLLEDFKKTFIKEDK